MAVIERDVIIVGGGAAGVFAAITCAEACPQLRVAVLERGTQFLSKVRISGGGRCNVTHACFDSRELGSYYPRGAQALLGPFARFQPSDTFAWFESRGVPLKTEADGRVFPVANSSQSIVDCLLQTAQDAGVELLANQSVDRVTRSDGPGFELALATGKMLRCGRLMLATGGCRAASAGQLAVSLGHTLESPVPSLFAFQVADAGLRSLAGISLESVKISITRPRLDASGALLITHGGLSGPAILRLSAWGARELHALNYRFPISVNWLPGSPEQGLAREMDLRRKTQPARLVVNSPLPPIPSRLWDFLVQASGIPRETRWAALSRSAQHRLILQLGATELGVVGKSLNKDEFVTCGGVRLSEINFKTMESRICPGLFFGGELLDIDGLTGGFNFQAAWTTGWIAGNALSGTAA
jgi:predicted Rossmann fold flavoprotein